MNVRDIPAFAIQWGPKTEPDETAQIEGAFCQLAPYFLNPEGLFLKTREEAFREYAVRTCCGYGGDALQDWLRGENRAVHEESENCQIGGFRFTSGSGAEFLAGVRAVLSVWNNPQVLYLSMHGNTDILSFDKAGTATIGFGQLSEVLAQSLIPEAALSLVLGCCKALDPQSDLLKTLPESVLEVYGFTGSPPASCVAKLFVGVLLDNARLYHDFHAQNQAIFGGGITGEDGMNTAFEDLKAAWTNTLDLFKECPNRLLVTSEGESVRVLKRVSYGDKTVWQGYEIEL